jgi:hypothetical protein
MRFLIINTDYPDFLQWVYAQHPGLKGRSYDEQIRMRHESLGGVADFYSSNLRAQGHEAYDIYANNECLQKAWAAEHGVHCDVPRVWHGQAESMIQRLKMAIGKTPMQHLKAYLRPVLYKWKRESSWLYEILKAQIQFYKPDVLLNQAVDCLSGRFINEIKPYVRLVVGQHAATPLSEDEDLSGYDMMISSFPPTLEYFRSKGICAKLSRLGFEPRVLSYLKSSEKVHDVTFVGNFFAVHSSREAWLGTVCRHVPQLKIWAPNREQMPSGSALRDHYAGQAWGREMYHVLHSSKVTLNHHGNVAPYANNMRLFEATGVRAFLVTDWKANLGDMFEVGKELVAYRSPEECVELIQYYLAHDEERDAIARAGQERTCREHTYAKRMNELVDLVRQSM